MTVDELTGLLQYFAPDLRVVVSGYKDGYEVPSPKQLTEVRIAANTGEHRRVGQDGDPNGLTASVDVIEALAPQ